MRGSGALDYKNITFTNPVVVDGGGGSWDPDTEVITQTASAAFDVSYHQDVSANLSVFGGLGVVFEGGRHIFDDAGSTSNHMAYLETARRVSLGASYAAGGYTVKLLVNKTSDADASLSAIAGFGF